jgi:Flp pilus assembly protein protease CpaA
MATLAYYDFRWYELPNWVMLPAIAICAHLTGNWQWALIMFAVGAGLFSFSWKCQACGHVEEHKHALSLHRGGDVKLFALIGAMIGWHAIVVCIVGYCSLFFYRNVLKNNLALPVTPFMFLPFVVAVCIK